MKQLLTDPRTPLKLPDARIAAIIVTWNKKACVLNLLSSLERIDQPGVRLFVVDNHSDDGTVEAIRSRHPHVTCIELPENLGGTGGFNAGLCAMLDRDTFDYVWLLDNDVEVEPDTLRTLLETLTRFPDAAIAGSHMIQLDAPETTNEIGAAVDLKNGRLLLQFHNTPEWMHRDEVYDVDYVAAASMLVRFEAIRTVGLWDDLFIHFDDVDWCLRMRSAGYRVLACAASRIRHVSGKSKCVTWMRYYDVRNMLYLQNKYGGYNPFHFINGALLHLFFAVRDTLTGRAYYGELAARALIDFFDGRMGRAPRLPGLNTTPQRKVIGDILGKRDQLVYIVEPTSRMGLTANDLQRAEARGIRFTALSPGAKASHGALPPDVPHMVLPGRPIRRILGHLRLALLGPRADYLFIDFDMKAGLLELCARRVVFMTGDGCLIAPGPWKRVLAALRGPLVWLRVLLSLARFLVSDRKGRAFAAQSVEAFKQRLAACGGRRIGEGS